MGLYATGYTSTLIDPFATQVLTALGTTVDRIGSGQADAACLRWFGDNTAGFKRTLAGRLRRMRSAINVRTISVGFERLGARSGGTNAGAWADSGDHTALDDTMGHVPGGREMVELDEGFSALPAYLVTLPNGTVDDGFYNQSKFETLIHELSHLLLGTDDEPWNGKDAYGAKRASRLAAANAALAQNNAENYGIFIEAVGRNRSS